MAGPEGVRDRSSKKATFKCQVLGWELAVSLRAGLDITYRWVAGQAPATLAAGTHLAELATSKVVPTSPLPPPEVGMVNG